MMINRSFRAAVTLLAAVCVLSRVAEDSSMREEVAIAPPQLRRKPTQDRRRYDSYQVWTLSLDGSNPEHMALWEWIDNNGEEISSWSHQLDPLGPVDVDVAVGPSGEDILREKMGHVRALTYSIKIQDVQALIDRESEQIETSRNTRESSDLDSFFSTYRNYNEMLQFLQDGLKMRAEANPALEYGVEVLPQATFEGNDQVVVQITNKDNRGLGNKPIIYWQAGLHSREWIAPMVVLYAAYQLVTLATTSEPVAEALTLYEFHFMPVVNVDGYLYTWQSRRLWRKTRSIRPDSRCVGADPNRNYGHSSWGSLRGASNDPCSETYFGVAPFSEPCVASSAQYLLNHKFQLLSVMDHHAYGQLYMYPWASTTSDTPDAALQDAVVAAAVDSIQQVSGLKYNYGSISKMMYLVTGNAKDWFYDPSYLGVTLSFGTELRPDDQPGFLLPAAEIVPTGEEIFASLLSQVKSFVSLGYTSVRGFQCGCQPGFYDESFRGSCDCVACPAGYLCSGGKAVPVPMCLSEVTSSNDPRLLSGCQPSVVGTVCSYSCIVGAEAENGGLATCRPPTPTKVNATWWPEPSCRALFDPCGTVQPCDVVATCFNGPSLAGFKCICPPGYIGNGQGPDGCTDIDECALQPSPCDSKASCYNHQGSYSCHCPPNHAGDGKGANSCLDTDACASAPCGEGTCVPTALTGFVCFCDPGLMGTTCQDKCLLDGRPCGGKQTKGCCSGSCTGGTCGPSAFPDVCTQAQPCQNGGTCIIISIDNTVTKESLTFEVESASVPAEGMAAEIGAQEAKQGVTTTSVIEDYMCKCPVRFSGIRCTDMVFATPTPSVSPSKSSSVSPSRSPSTSYSPSSSLSSSLSRSSSRSTSLSGSSSRSPSFSRSSSPSISRSHSSSPVASLSLPVSEFVTSSRMPSFHSVPQNDMSSTTSRPNTTPETSTTTSSTTMPLTAAQATKSASTTSTSTATAMPTTSTATAMPTTSTATALPTSTKPPTSSPPTISSLPPAIITSTSSTTTTATTTVSLSNNTSTQTTESPATTSSITSKLVSTSTGSTEPPTMTSKITTLTTQPPTSTATTPKSTITLTTTPASSTSTTPKSTTTLTTTPPTSTTTTPQSTTTLTITPLTSTTTTPQSTTTRTITPPTSTTTTPQSTTALTITPPTSTTTAPRFTTTLTIIPPTSTTTTTLTIIPPTSTTTAPQSTTTLTVTPPTSITTTPQSTPTLTITPPTSTTTTQSTTTIVTPPTSTPAAPQSTTTLTTQLPSSTSFTPQSTATNSQAITLPAASATIIPPTTTSPTTTGTASIPADPRTTIIPVVLIKSSTTTIPTSTSSTTSVTTITTPTTITSLTTATSTSTRLPATTTATRTTAITGQLLIATTQRPTTEAPTATAAAKSDALSACFTLGGKACVFPFSYDEREYTSCTDTESDGEFWCAIELDADSSIADWDMCLPCEPPMMTIEPSGATTAPRSLEVSSTTRLTLTSSSPRKDCVVQTGTGAGNLCVPFYYNGEIRTGCIADDNEGKLWCATAVDQFQKVLYWGNCGGCGQDAHDLYTMEDFLNGEFLLSGSAKVAKPNHKTQEVATGFVFTWVVWMLGLLAALAICASNLRRRLVKEVRLQREKLREELALQSSMGLTPDKLVESVLSASRMSMGTGENTDWSDLLDTKDGENSDEV
eukprot:gb/GEZN01000234.1/.p1 GENE.gb/GEZN01000234.1/~~gb/GEZN01000234.1/.p1  ORF type:complete len:1688 (-),score=145.61 gb/GEZN01000234.1/:360-5375(-)